MRGGSILSGFFALLVFLIVVQASVQTSQEGQNLFVTLHLPHGISVEVPRSWHILAGEAEEVLETTSPGDIDLSRMPLPNNNVLLRATATPADRPASMAVVLLPQTLLPPSQAVALSPRELQDYDQALRSRVDSLCQSQGIELLEWGGTREDRLNGRLALVSEYRRRSRGTPAVWEQINTIPLDAGTLILTVAHSEHAGLLWRSVVMRIRSSCRVNTE